MNQFKERKNEFYEERKNLKEKLDILYDAIGELEVAEPSIPLTQYGMKFLELLKNYTTLKSKVAFHYRAVKEYLKQKEAVMYMKVRSQLDLEGKKITEGIIDAMITQDDEIFKFRLLRNEYDVLEQILEDECNLIVEIIQMLKKIADIKATVNVKLATNFEIGG